MNSAILEKESESIAVDPNEILTVQQAAQVLKVSYSHMLRLIRGQVSGMPPVHHVRAGRSVRIRRGALTEWIRSVENLSVPERAWQ
jgi:excisionase family DNA binding protein